MQLYFNATAPKNCSQKDRPLVTPWKVSKYRVFSGPYFPVFGLYTFHAVNFY